jgi:hypothetical protein
MNAITFSDDLLDALAKVADPQADDIVKGLTRTIMKNHPGGRPDDSHLRRDVFPQLLHEIGRDSPEAHVATFLSGGAECDAKIDPKLVRDAQTFFETNGVAVITALFHASLPEAYLGKRGVQVLDMTGELVSNWTRRIQETGQFLINVLSPAPELARGDKTSLSAGEFGARAVRRVRLTHAAVRWFLMAPYEPPLDLMLLADFRNPRLWDVRMVEIGQERPGKDGPKVGYRPLNQEDLLATLGTFTTVVFDALEKLAVPFSEHDKRAFYHLWNVVGWHLGIGDAKALKKLEPERPTQGATQPWPGNNILPLDVEEMDALYRRLAARLQGGTTEGRRLTKTLVQELAYPLPRPLDRAPAFFVRYFVGDRRADLLEVERGGYFELLTSRTGALQRAARRAPNSRLGKLTFSPLSQAVTRYALRTFVSQSRGKDRGFVIDPATASRWGVQTGPEVRSPVRS